MESDLMELALPLAVLPWSLLLWESRQLEFELALTLADLPW